jgi:uncharacterized iron-regulated membrane protein
MSFVSTFVHHPRKLWLRRALFQIHLWVGVLLSVYVVVIALTGSVLVFRSELTRAQLPRSFAKYDAAKVAPVAVVMERFATAYPGEKIGNLQTPSEVMPAYVIAATDAQQRPLRLVADPVSAALQVEQRTWLDWVYDLHVYLLLGKAYGMQVNGVGAALLMVLAVSGIVLWWPGLKVWARGFRVSVGRSWRRINFDLHSVIGFWTLFIVFWWALSGVYFAWYRQVSATIAFVSPLHGMVSPMAPQRPKPGPERASLEQILEAVHRASPSGRLFSLSDPSRVGATTFALVDLRAAGDFSHRDIVMLSTTDARVLTIWHYGENESVGDWVLWAMHPLHFGTLWGLPLKVLWAGLGVALALLTVTGLLMYWNRFLRHKF